MNEKKSETEVDNWINLFKDKKPDNGSISLNNLP